MPTLAELPCIRPDDNNIAEPIIYSHALTLFYLHGSTKLHCRSLHYNHKQPTLAQSVTPQSSCTNSCNACGYATHPLPLLLRGLLVDRTFGNVRLHPPQGWLVAGQCVVVLAVNIHSQPSRRSDSVWRAHTFPPPPTNAQPKQNTEPSNDRDKENNAAYRKLARSFHFPVPVLPTPHLLLWLLTSLTTMDRLSTCPVYCNHISSSRSLRLHFTQPSRVQTRTPHSTSLQSFSPHWSLCSSSTGRRNLTESSAYSSFAPLCCVLTPFPARTHATMGMWVGVWMTIVHVVDWPSSRPFIHSFQRCLPFIIFFPTLSLSSDTTTSHLFISHHNLCDTSWLVTTHPSATTTTPTTTAPA